MIFFSKTSTTDHLLASSTEAFHGLQQKPNTSGSLHGQLCHTCNTMMCGDLDVLHA